MAVVVWQFGRRVRCGIGAFALAAASVGLVGLEGCKSSGGDVTQTDRPSEGSGSDIEREMAGAGAAPHNQEVAAEAKMETQAGEAANKQLAANPPPAQQVQPAQKVEPPAKADQKPAEAKAETKPESKAEAKQEAKPDVKPEAKPVVTFLNCDDAPAIATKKQDNGLIIEDLKMGEGAECKSGATVTINYHGTLKDGGKMFDTTRGKQPATFPLNRLIKGWQQGVPGMKPGGIRRLTVPSALAYGDSGRPPVIPPKSDLVFIIELIGVVEPTK